MFIFLLTLAILLSFTYAIIIAWVIRHWKRLPIWEVPKNFTAHTKVSVLIPARNEGQNIGRLLDCIIAQNYPKALLQVIVIDDHSEDDTAQIVNNYTQDYIQLISLADYIDRYGERQSFKKMAIESAISIATGELIIQTDADCWMGTDWIRLHVSMYQNRDCKMIAAPVNFSEERNLLERFQSLDFTGMMAVTGAGVYSKFMWMCNGANLSYSKEIFHEVDGFSGNEDKSSGDDMFLMHKIATLHPEKIYYLKNFNVTTYTHGKPNLKSFYHQRLRWATKNASYSDYRVILINVLVFFTCVAIFSSLFLLPLSPSCMLIALFSLILGKGISDFIFLRITSSFFNRPELMKSFLPSFFMHTTYIFLIGIMANIVSKYEWKGRKTS